MAEHDGDLRNAAQVFDLMHRVCRMKMGLRVLVCLYEQQPLDAIVGETNRRQVAYAAARLREHGLVQGPGGQPELSPLGRKLAGAVVVAAARHAAEAESSAV